MGREGKGRQRGWVKTSKPCEGHGANMDTDMYSNMVMGRSSWWVQINVGYGYGLTDEAGRGR